MSGFLETATGDRQAITDGMIIGRDKRADVVLADNKASRRHAKLISQGGVVEIEDLGSSNGTRLNGKPVEKRMLRDGDVVQIGKTELTFREGAAPAPAAAGFDAGDDLFGDDPEPVASPKPEPKPKAEPQPEPGSETVAPSQAATPASSPAAAPKPEPFEPVVEVRAPKDAAPTDAGPKDEVLEFADDDVVVVKRTVPAKSEAKAAAAEAQPSRDGGVLQFHKVEDKRSVAMHDFSQMSGGMRALLIVVALGVAAGLFYLTMKLVG